MDRKSWPWKKKSSDKASVESTSAATVSNPSHGDEAKQESYKKPKYVQISVESYSHLTGLEDQVKSYEEHVRMFEDEVKELTDKLSAAEDEMTVKDNLVKQHAKVAEEAVSGWEKAEAEAATLKTHLESVTLLKLTAEDRASHLDGALKECMRQIRNLKEEHEQNLHDVLLNRTKQFDKVRVELEAKISSLEQELLRSAAENSALSRSLQDRSNMLVKLSEEKAEAEAEIQHLKSEIESCEKEINSLKYELHVVAKELEIRNEEKNMCSRSAEAANKQHLEGVKKIAKLEAECQRLRGLVRKRLPGPAALAQMKLEVESLGRDYEESRLRKSPGKPPHYSPEYSFDNIHKFQKENEHLTERLLGMEEETKLLKEALAKRNSELQASRTSCAKTASKLQSLEAALLQANNDDHHRSPSKNMGGASFYNNHLSSLTSMSEDGIDDTISCSGSWATSVIPEASSHIKKDNNNNNNFESPCRSDSASHLELMDDFLEMEKLAYLSNETNMEVESADTKKVSDTSNSQELSDAICQILDFLKSTSEELDGFSATYKDFSNLEKFVIDLSALLTKVSKSSETEISSADCIDKVALPENKLPQKMEDGYSDSTSDPDILVPTSEPWKCSSEEFEQLKLEKENLTESLEGIRAELVSAQRTNELGETQLKCMAESYKSLETRAEKLEAEAVSLRMKVEALEKELEEERRGHENALARCQDLQEEMERIESLKAEIDAKTSQEKELAEAAAKLAECQETIFLLGKQLKGLRPPQAAEVIRPNQDSPLNEVLESNLEMCDGPFSPSDSESVNPLRSPLSSKSHRPTKSTIPYNQSPEKNSRGFSRFFSSKGKY